jgi:hypothetical protein
LKKTRNFCVNFLRISSFCGEKTVEYEGKTYSLTGLAKQLSGKKYAVAGPRFFKYNGEWLNDIRHRLGV